MHESDLLNIEVIECRKLDGFERAKTRLSVLVLLVRFFYIQSQENLVVGVIGACLHADGTKICFCVFDAVFSKPLASTTRFFSI